MGMANQNHDAFQIQNDPRWSAVVDRAASFDGKFVYAVKSTGVYRWGVDRKRALLKAEARRA